MVSTNAKRNGPKPKMTKDERRAKYTQIARDRREKKFQRERSRDTVCFKCRQKGHTSSQCGEAVICCYKCGSLDHSLKECRLYGGKSDFDLPHATCYICSGKGHLASKCPTNSKGIYVNGGACRNCGSTQHVSQSCPNKKEEKEDKTICVPEESFDDLLEDETVAVVASAVKKAPVKTKRKKKVVKF